MTKPLNAFWLRKLPRREFDIARLRPATNRCGERFETKADMISESRRSGELLLKARQTELAAFLADCREGHYICERPACPICARTFRRWYIGQLLELSNDASSAWIVTILLEQAQPGSILRFNLERARALLRKRLTACLGTNGSAAGCFEIVYRSNLRSWVFHANILILGAKQSQVKRFSALWRSSAFDRAAKHQELKDLAKQVSYVPKFTTYHRPGKRRNGRRPAAKPLNPHLHGELVRWMNRFSFKDFIILFRMRRRGAVLLAASVHKNRV